MIRFPKKSKFNSVINTYNGIKFDSIKEKNRYIDLLFLQKAGEIYDLKLQPVFPLIPNFQHKGVKYRGVKYVADFSYRDKSGQYIVEDVKSAFTRKNRAYIIKKKLLLREWGDSFDKFIET